MDPIRNPYSPGAGVRPLELAGRSREIERFEIVRERAMQGRARQSMVLTGLRGVGKTVLLNELEANARRAGWITAKIEADLSDRGAEFREQLAQALAVSLRQTRSRTTKATDAFKAALSTFRSFTWKLSPDGSMTFGIDVSPDTGRADSGTLLTDLTDLALDLGEAAKSLSLGCAVFIDEMQHLPLDDLAAICHACHNVDQRNLPFVIVGAGLPSLPGLLAEAKSYAERLFDYTTIGRLNPADAHAALLRPAADEDVEWTPDSASLALDAADGYPYFIQQFGSSIWDTAIESPITEQDAALGIDIGRQRLDAGFFRARWERATPAERDYLIAMSNDGDGPSSSGEVARRLGKRQSSLGPARANLIAKGLIYAPEHGQIAFTVPGMADFVTRESNRS